MKPELEIVIASGKISALDNEFLLSQDLGGKTSFVRTTEIDHNPEAGGFVIKFCKRGTFASVWCLMSVTALDLEQARAWKAQLTAGPNGVLVLSSYKTAVDFEKWIIPLIRELHGADYV